MSYVEKIIEQTEHSTLIACMAAEFVFILFLIAVIIIISFRFREIKRELKSKEKDLSDWENIGRMGLSNGH